jgi:hypothetical protein
MKQLLVFLILTTVLPATIRSQIFPVEKCGIPTSGAPEKSLDNWGYGYADLLEDLDLWAESPYISIDSLGASVQNRAIWQLTITSDLPASTPRKTVVIHARTHPNEVQAWWVTDEIINLLLSEEDYAQLLRETCIFHIIPMYNPDGVTLGFPRENAHDIDIESNWDEDPVEPEVAVLRSRFTELMNSESPVEVALNMHSAYACKRYFVFHDDVGTSYAYTQIEKDFIGDVRSYYEAGIEPWHYKVTWTSGTPTYYPESWWWLNHGAAVLALTYEDMNCTSAGNYDQTAFALLNGISDFLELTATVAVHEPATGPLLLGNYPNPVTIGGNSTTGTIIKYELQETQEVNLSLVDANARLVKVLGNGTQTAGTHRVYFNPEGLSAGMYFYVLKTPTGQKVGKMIIQN